MLHSYIEWDEEDQADSAGRRGIRTMSSSDPQPRFGQSVKGLLSDKVGSCSGDVIALTRQVLKGSRSQELLSQAARNMVIQEDAILHAEDVSVQQMCVRGSLQGQLMSVCPSESEEDVHHHHTPAVPAGGHPEECGALQEPPGPADPPAEVKLPAGGAAAESGWWQTCHVSGNRPSRLEKTSPGPSQSCASFSASGAGHVGGPKTTSGRVSSWRTNVSIGAFLLFWNLLCIK
ncbi:UPF0693 protein C10orf32-like [Oryzias melastigma]|uniref:BLOC-1-related complex subunit 7 n=1 Tax=Oryzias melastigma TaxID=30732 RepID=A0A834FNJ5_ORYME|nr:UPF0693 protein C10orf32-like [Oryzias melastigma]